MLALAPTVLDLYCGCGGLSHGFIEAGFRVVMGIDAWPDAIKTFEHNHKNSKGLVADLASLSPHHVSSLINAEKIDVIIGGPPCQGFSIAGKRQIDDVRNTHYKNFVAFVDFFQPKAFLMENVPNIISMAGGTIKDHILKTFTDLGYHVQYKILTASDYGVPQKRKRAFFIGFKHPSKFTFPAPFTLDKIVTSAQAISDLPVESLPNNSPYPIAAQSDYQHLMRLKSSGVCSHEVSKHTEQTVRLIGMIPDGGNYKSLPLDLQDTRRVNIAWTRLNSQKPSFTIDTGHRHHFHYSFNRIPTVRESARIQSFPDHFHFLCSKTSQYRQVGNAVPPLLAQCIAKAMLEQL